MRTSNQALIRWQLTPFVSMKIRKRRGQFNGDPKGSVSGEAYLAKWKHENGET